MLFSALGVGGFSGAGDRIPGGDYIPYNFPPILKRIQGIEKLVGHLPKNRQKSGDVPLK